MKNLLLVSVCCVGLVTAVKAHHGGGSYWTADRLVGPVSGTATDFSFNFPHVSFALDIPDEQGNAVNHTMSIRWTPTVLRKMGWRRDLVTGWSANAAAFVPHKLDPTVGSLRSLEVNDAPLAIEPPEAQP